MVGNNPSKSSRLTCHICKLIARTVALLSETSSTKGRLAKTNKSQTAAATKINASKSASATEIFEENEDDDVEMDQDDGDVA